MKIRLVELVNGHTSEFSGKWVVDYDPFWRHPDGSYDGGRLRVTRDIAKAKDFPDLESARAYWMQVNGKTRPDGKPDRPLTAWTVEIHK